MFCLHPTSTSLIKMFNRTEFNTNLYAQHPAEFFPSTWSCPFPDNRHTTQGPKTASRDVSVTIYLKPQEQTILTLKMQHAEGLWVIGKPGLMLRVILPKGPRSLLKVIQYQTLSQSEETVWSITQKIWAQSCLNHWTPIKVLDQGKIWPGFWFKMATWQAPKYTSSDKPKLQLYMKKFPLKNPKIVEWCLHIGQKRGKLHQNEQERLRRKLTMKPTHATVTHDEEETQNLKLLPDGWFVCVCHIMHPSFSYWHLKDKHPKHLALKTIGASFCRTHGAWWAEEWLLKRLYANSFATGPSTKAAFWKVPRLYLKETHFLI